MVFRGRSTEVRFTVLPSPVPMPALALPLDIPISLPEQRRISVDEYHRMVEAGIFDEDDRVELLEGVLVFMPPMGDPHSHVVQELNHRITRALPEGYRTRPQLPITLRPFSEPEPDLCVIELLDGPARVKHPETALLIIEVADSSLRYDRQAKGPVYASFGIPEYWIIDVQGRAVEVYRVSTHRPCTRIVDDAARRGFPRRRHGVRAVAPVPSLGRSSSPLEPASLAKRPALRVGNGGKALRTSSKGYDFARNPRAIAARPFSDFSGKPCHVWPPFALLDAEGAPMFPRHSADYKTLFWVLCSPPRSCGHSVRAPRAHPVPVVGELLLRDRDAARSRTTTITARRSRTSA